VAQRIQVHLGNERPTWFAEAESPAHSVAVDLLRNLLKAHLHQTPSWNPADLDKTLLSATSGQLSLEGTSD
jgi:hypothetical protein